MLTKNMLSCKNNSENCYTKKKVKHKPSGYAWCSICSFDDTKKRRYIYRRKDCTETFCKGLKKLRTETINLCKEEFCDNKTKEKVRDFYHYTGKFRAAAHNGWNLRYKVPKEVPVVFHNGST